MKKHITDPKTIARRERRKKLLLWQGEQLERFKPFKLVRQCK